MNKKDKKRVDRDVRPQFFTPNYDYGEPGLGTGLYRGPMDRFKSVKDFLEHSRKQRAKRKKKLLAFLLDNLKKTAGEVIPYNTFRQKRLEKDLDLRRIFPPEALQSWEIDSFYPDRIAATLTKDKEKIASFDIGYLVEEDVSQKLIIRVKIWDKINGETLGFVPVKDFHLLIPRLDTLIAKLEWLLE